jgi:hypothetical protein
MATSGADCTVRIEGVSIDRMPPSKRKPRGMPPTHVPTSARLHANEEDGRLVLAPGRLEPRLVERDGFLVVDVRLEGEVEADLGRDERLRGLVEYALKR